MVTSKFISWLSLGGMAATLMGCPVECLSPQYRFGATVHISPEAEVLAVGDTVWIDSTTPTTMRDLQTGKDVAFANADNFGTAIRIAELRASSDTLLDAVNRFRYFALMGRAFTDPKLHPNRSLGCYYAQVGSEYRLRLGLVCQRAGIYGLFISSAVNVTQQGKTVCDGANIGLSFDNADKHLSYLQNLYYKSQPMEPGAIPSSYCFVVR